MKRLIVLLFVVSCAAQMGKPPYVNNRNLMRGARCQVFDRTAMGAHEEKFGDVKSITVTKTVDGKEWVIAISDFDNCTLSFWTDTAEMNTPTIVNALTAY